MFRQLAFFLLSSLFFAMAGDSDPNDILFTLLGGMHSKGKESPLQNINNIRDTFAKGIGIPRKSLDSMLVLFTLLAGIPSKEKELPLQNIKGIKDNVATEVDILRKILDFLPCVCMQI